VRFFFFYLLNSLNSPVLMLQAIERYSGFWDCQRNSYKVNITFIMFI